MAGKSAASEQAGDQEDGRIQTRVSPVYVEMLDKIMEKRRWTKRVAIEEVIAAYHRQLESER